MKKIYTLFALSFILLTACNKDTGANSASNAILPKKIVEAYSNYPATRTLDFSYNGNKISEINITPNSDVSKIKYTYVGDDITKIENFIGATYAAYTSAEFTYQNGKVISSVQKGSAGNVLNNITYTYNSDGSITIKNTPTTVGYLPTIKKVYVTNNNITKEEYYDSNNALYNTITYEYDLTKYSYAKNITGFAYTFTEADGNINCLTKRTTTYASGTTTPIVENVTNTFNNDGYPTQMVKPYNGSATVTVTKTITY